MDVTSVVNVRNIQEAHSLFLVDRITLIHRLQEDQRHPQFPGIAPRTPWNPSCQRFPLHCHAITLPEVVLHEPGVHLTLSLIVQGKSAGESSPHIFREATTSSHASEEFYKRVSCLKALGAPELKHPRDGFEEPESMLDLWRRRLLPESTGMSTLVFELLPIYLIA